MDVSSPAFRILAGLLEARTGQQLGANRRWRIDTVLGPILRARNIETIDSLVAKVIGGSDPRLTDEVVDALINNETYFFRDMTAFQMLGEQALNSLAQLRSVERRLRIWCAGCSTGQEAYSIAMILADQATRWAGWTVDLVATDVSGGAIERARGGLYSQFEIQRGLPVRQMMRWFTKEGEDWRISPALAGNVRFQRLSLTDRPPAPGTFDIILCRNVLLYFGPEMRRRVFDALGNAIAPDGVLMLGAGETVLGQTERFTLDAAHRGLYRPAGSQPLKGRRAA